DIPTLRVLSRAGYRARLEGGVRVFEWNGPMLHAKTAVADGQWARVGSTNLNLSSWMGNWELDVAVEDSHFAQAMAEMFLQDLEHSTEIVLSARRKVRATGQPQQQRRMRVKPGQGSAGRAVAGAVRISNAVGAAITNHRVLGPAEAKIMASGGLALLVLAFIALLWPRVIVLPLAALAGWVAVALLVRTYKLWVLGKKAQATLASRPSGSRHLWPIKWGGRRKPDTKEFDEQHPHS
ncbi:MAG: phospholipase D-like domain-containing protein, partial [Candidatus Binatia bacterium]